MNKHFYSRLAASNIKKNGKTYLPYLFTCIITVAMFYIVKSLSLNESLEQMIGADTLTFILAFGSWIIAGFSAIFLFYTNSFLMKRRKKEFGVFNILGMEKKHISKVIAIETVYVALISLAAGLVLGIVLDKAMYLLITNMLGLEITLGFYISGQAIFVTAVLFCTIFVLIFINSLRQIYFTNPVDLLRGGNVGEKEPKTKWVIAVFGMISLGTGYYISVSTESPVTAVLLFFPAVILVIFGTYLLFTAGSIALLKLLRKNKKYYYQTKHFTSVSGMIYRMKQNAVGLANICILSTMVLVMVSSTTSMMIGIDDIIQKRFHNDIGIDIDTSVEQQEDTVIPIVQALLAEQQMAVSSETTYTYLSFPAVRMDDVFVADTSDSGLLVNPINNVFLITVSDYNKISGDEKELQQNEIMIYSDQEAFDREGLKLFDREYTIKEHLPPFIGSGALASDISSSQFIVIPDMDELQELYRLQKEAYGERASNIRLYYGIDLDEEGDTQIQFYESLQGKLFESSFSGTLECRAEALGSMMGFYGGFFFLGIFLGALFLIATILIIYYKQISEGYDDKVRFAIMQKVGMNHSEVKHSIHSQIVTVFFLPLIVAGIHVAFAFPLVSRVLGALNLVNTSLYILCTAVCFLVFAAVYGMIYAFTAKTYYRIVSSGE